jgi:hypothetical protein
VEAIERISADAREVHLGRLLLTALAAVFYALGWAVAKLVIGVWTAISWSLTALRLGWQDAHRSRLR